MAAPPTNSYEQMRLENIRKNEELLRSLQLTVTPIPSSTSDALYVAPAAASSSASRGKSTQTAARRSSRIVTKPYEPPVATRRSARIANMPAPSETGLDDTADVVATPKPVKVDSGIDSSALRQLLEGMVVTDDKVVKPEEDSTRTGKDEKSAATQLRDRFNRLRVAHGEFAPAIKLTPERVYTLAFHPDPRRALISCGDKAGNLTFWDVGVASQLATANQDSTWSPTTYSYRAHAATVFFQGFPAKDPTHLITAGYDNKIRRLNLAKGEFEDVLTRQNPRGKGSSRSEDELLTSVALTDHAELMYYGTNRGLIARLDVRMAANDRPIQGQYPDMADAKIGALDVNPVYPDYLAVASNARYLRVFDIRNMAAPVYTDDPDADDALPGGLLGQWAHEKSVNHCAWSPDGRSVVTVSHDNFLRVFHAWQDTTNTFSHPEIKIHHNNQTGRWVTMLRARWIPQSSPAATSAFICASMEKYVDVFSGRTGHRVCRLDQGGLTSVPAVVAIHPSQDWVVGGNATGKVTLWC